MELFAGGAVVVLALLAELAALERQLVAEEEQPMQIEGLDHLVLTVRDIDATCRFYGEVLGLKVVVFGSGRRALQCGDQKINLHEHGREFEPKAHAPTPGSADLCLITSAPIEEVLTTLAAHGVPVVEGPVRRTGARGPILSVYLRDPDQNLVEVARYIEERGARSEG